MDMNTGLAFPKGRTRKQRKASADRFEDKVKGITYRHCYDREQGGCAVLTRLSLSDATELITRFGTCGRRLELMHLSGNRRAHTMKMAAFVRHDPRFCLMGCDVHHEAEEHQGLRFVGIDPELGMDSPTIGWYVLPPKVTP